MPLTEGAISSKSGVAAAAGAVKEGPGPIDDSPAALNSLRKSRRDCGYRMGGPCIVARYGAHQNCARRLEGLRILD
jgi:hypothetical protein